MPSIWKKPFGRYMVRAIAAFMLLALLSLAYPFVSGTLRWIFHRKVTYWNADFQLPFRWVFDERALPLTFRKATVRALATGFDSYATFSGSFDKPITNPRERYKALEKSLYHDSSRIDIPASKEGSGIFCYVQQMRENLISATCFTDDGTWHLQYLGSRHDLPEGEWILRNIQPHGAKR